MHEALIMVLVALMPGVLWAQTPPPAAPEEIVESSTPPAEPAAPLPPETALPAIGLLVKVELSSGDSLRGTLVAADATVIVLELPGAGRISLQRNTVVSVKEDKRAKAGDDGQIYRRDPNRTRYLYGPSAIGLDAGEGYVSQKEMLFTAAAYGVTDNVTVLAGTVIPVLFAGEFMGIVALKLTHTLIEDTLHVAVGSEVFIAGFADVGALGFVFGSATYGNDERHFTLTVGKPFQMDADSRELGPAILTASGTYRLTYRLAAVTENWLVLPDEDGDILYFNGLAARFIWDDWALDLGGIFVTDFEAPIPWLDITYNW